MPEFRAPYMGSAPCTSRGERTHTAPARSFAWSVRTQNLTAGPRRHRREIVLLANVVAPREFGKRSTLPPSPSGLGPLRRRQFRRSPHVLSALLRPAAALAGADADKLALYVGEAASTAIISRAVLVPVQCFSVPSLRTKPCRAYSSAASLVSRKDRYSPSNRSYVRLTACSLLAIPPIGVERKNGSVMTRSS
jgi:hypothetical protein